MKGIINLPLVPLRKSDSESSEMTSQLLFGELVEVLETHECWLLLRNISDNYVGWADRKMIRILKKHDEQRLSSSEPYCVSYPLIEGENRSTGEKLMLPGGSRLVDLDGINLEIGGKTFLFDPILLPYTNELSGSRLIELAKQYLNAPYLWGGKTIMGIDCSGLVQVVFSMCGMQLPRDAEQQVELGKVIDFLHEVKPGDLAFFENPEGDIIHVGILLNSHQIIHASGWVKIETIDSQGIISSQTGEYTHNLRVVKRLL
jgi:gamma-D-glutamyl-L-lysine dipeptidyl-peptidase